MLVLAAFYVATSAEVLLLVIAITHLEMLEQLLPFVRFDGYFILSDLVGVPDLFARVVPVVRSSLSRWPGASGRRRDPRATGLRRGARIVITVWVLCVIPLLAFTLGYLVVYLPEVNRALWHSASHTAHLTGAAVAGHRYAAAAADVLGIGLVLMSLAGSLYVAVGLVRRAVAFGRRWSAGRPRRRLVAFFVGLACAVSLWVIWLVQGEFSDW
jgi:putative peptide zinc metalloprotease protein